MIIFAIGWLTGVASLAAVLKANRRFRMRKTRIPFKAVHGTKKGNRVTIRFHGDQERLVREFERAEEWRLRCKAIRDLRGDKEDDYLPPSMP